MRAPGPVIVEVLGNLPLFQEMSADELARIASGVTEHVVPKGSFLFQRGDPCLGFHVVRTGQVKLGFVSSQGNEKVIEICGPGTSFGEALMFTDRAYVVFAQALTDATVLHIAKQSIDVEIERDPRLARRMIAGLSARLHGLVQDVEAYSLRSGMQRVIGYLLRGVDERAASQGGPLRLVLDANKGVIASRLNLTPEHFSRILAELVRDGAIEVHGAEITILDLQRIRRSLD
jgi:CRP-like cAMP-binding protein